MDEVGKVPTQSLDYPNISFNVSASESENDIANANSNIQDVNLRPGETLTCTETGGIVNEVVARKEICESETTHENNTEDCEPSTIGETARQVLDNGSEPNSNSSSESPNIDTESADEMLSSEERLSNLGTIEDEVHKSKSHTSDAKSEDNISLKSLEEKSEDNISLISYGSSHVSASKFKNNVYTESTGDEEDLLSELESELQNSKSEKTDTPSHNKKTGSGLLGKSDKPCSRETYEIQIDILQQNVTQLQQELVVSRATLISQQNEYKETIDKMKQDFAVKTAKLTKQLDSAIKDKENMVLRYASSEKEGLILKKSKDDMEKKMREVVRDRESLLVKIRQLHADRVRACSSLDTKLAEMAHMQREFEKMREELNNRDIKIKWAQNKLKSESDAHKETELKLEQTLHRLHETREESEQIRKDCQEMIRRYQEAEEIKSVSLDIQLKQKLSELEMQKQERFDQEEVYGMLRQELDALKKRQKISMEENNVLTVKIQTLERERLEYEQNLSKLKDSQNTLRQEVVDLNSKLSEMDSLKQQLEREKERVTAARNEAERIRQANIELQADMDACHLKEGELLQFTEKLTSKSVHLQSENSLLELKVQKFEQESTQLSKRVEELEQTLEQIRSELQTEKDMRMQETQLLARKLAEKTKLAESLNIKLEEALNENKVMKRRHLASVKELSRELYHTKKRLDNYETVSQSGSALGVETTSLGSRTSSSNSLDMMGHSLQNGLTSSYHLSGASNNQRFSPPQVSFSGVKPSSDHNANKDQHSNSLTNANSVGKTNGGSSCPHCGINNLPANNSNQSGVEIDRQVLIERIFKLQNQLARKNEKNEFLEEHNNQLLGELKKKSKIIQKYVLESEAGALVSSTMDQNKADLAKKGGGVMASVYNNQVTDNHLTLKLSLEINQKLQAVLEDTLLKNITLKENINTLGEEIARITKEQRDLQQTCSKSFK